MGCCIWQTGLLRLQPLSISTQVSLRESHLKGLLRIHKTSKPPAETE